MLSVALCTYNGEKYIEKQLQSILNQTLPVDEIMVCDDGSIDDTIPILTALKKKHSDLINIVVNKTQKGARENFLSAIKLCHGDIIFLCDQDDIWLPHKVETICDYFHEHPSIETVFTDAYIINEEGATIETDVTLWYYFFDSTSRKRCDKGMMVEEFCTGSHATGATMAFRKRLVERFSPLHNRLWHDEMISMTSVASHSLGYIEESLIKYRIHYGQQIGVPNSEESIVTKDYRQPLLPYKKFSAFLNNKEDVKRVRFLHTRCNSKHQLLGCIVMPVFLGSYIKYYGKNGLSFLSYDMCTSFKHSLFRISRKIHKCFPSSYVTESQR